MNKDKKEKIDVKAIKQAKIKTIELNQIVSK
jgi:hypothetical protein